MSSPTAGPPSQGVSIVITTYNHARFLREAVDSALAQTVPPLEVIVVDDGSTDNPASVLPENPSLRLIRQRNQGLAAARNTGWRAARGEFLVFLDADDRLLPEALEVNLAQYRDHPGSGFVYAGHRKIDAEGRVLYRDNLKVLGADPYAMLLTRNPVAMHATVMYRRSLLQAVGGFNPSLNACEDLDIFLRIAREHPVVASKRTIAEYRRHEANMSYNAPMMLRAALTVLRAQEPFAVSRPEWQSAYRDGLARWKGYFAGEQARALASSGGLSLALIRHTLAMFWLAPLAMARALLDRTGPQGGNPS